eukprot:6187745-Pleurochrysis_carterae.AAC.1
MLLCATPIGCSCQSLKARPAPLRDAYMRMSFVTVSASESCIRFGSTAALKLLCVRLCTLSS